MKKKIILISFVYILLLTTLVSSIGVTPPRIIVDNMLKENLIEKSIKVIDIKENSKLSIQITGEGKDWIKIKEGNNVFVEDTEKEITFQIKIPKEIPNGNYKSKVQITNIPETEESKIGNTASVISGIMVKITLEVSDEEIIKYNIRRVEIPDIEVGMPLTVVMDIDNQGNVLAKPKKIELSIINEKTKEEIKKFTSKEFTSVEPFKIDQSITHFDIGLPEGLYFANVEIQTEEEIVEENELPFNIFPKGTLNSSAELIELKTQDNIENIAKITAIIKNTGKIEVSPEVVFEIYKDESLKEIIKTDSKYIQKNEEKEFESIYNIKEKGKYTIRAYAEFSNKKSNILETTFTSTHSEIPIQNIILIALVVLLGGYIGYGKIKTKRRTK